MKPAEKIIDKNKPIIDQTISQNIMSYVNNLTKKKTIKEIYDDITNDGRLTLQQNLNDLEANDSGTQFIIGEKYGTTQFDTYSLPLVSTIFNKKI